MRCRSFFLSEDQEQRILIEWATLKSFQFPSLRLLYHVPNGGLRQKVVAAKLKAQGVKSGVPDLVLPVARHGFHGLYIEMKREADSTKRVTTTNKKLSDDQIWWRDALRAEGYKVETCYGFVQGKKILEEYLSIPGEG